MIINDIENASPARGTALLKTAFRRCAERQLSRIIAVEVFAAFLVWASIAYGMTAALGFYPFGTDGKFVSAPIMATGFCLPLFSFGNFIACGLIREILLPEMRVLRGLRSGAKRWRGLFYLLPWYAAAWFATVVLLDVERRCGNTAATVLWYAGRSLLAMVTTFLTCAVAVGHADIRFREVYKRAVAAVKNGWGRFFVGLLAALLLYKACLLLFDPYLIVLDVYPELMMSKALYGWHASVIVILLKTVAIWGVFRVVAFFMVYMMNLFVDASGITRAEMGLPDEDKEAETVATTCEEQVK